MTMTIQRFAFGTLVGGLVLFFLGISSSWLSSPTSSLPTRDGDRRPEGAVQLRGAWHRSVGVGRGADADPGLGLCLERGSGRQGLRSRRPAVLLRHRPDDVCDDEHLDAEACCPRPDYRRGPVRSGRRRNRRGYSQEVKRTNPEHERGTENGGSRFQVLGSRFVFWFGSGS